jgi:hypothetical protein
VDCEVEILSSVLSRGCPTCITYFGKSVAVQGDMRVAHVQNLVAWHEVIAETGAPLNFPHLTH